MEEGRKRGMGLSRGTREVEREEEERETGEGCV
jgi:hypothetical protein